MYVKSMITIVEVHLKFLILLNKISSALCYKETVI